ncbi:anthranilate synthase, component I [Archaeoglobus sulfaticallidus PM70-1]|uniref:Anthranilate synthase component 1 n=1 Tax=Archaeoglobus sulfaticallidus PM70-1 TaxID=387631 RepID=N0BKG0_9EURY|nr:anthranilate synthase component I [Archaeoglobus sulfaticallidus]AGK60665.1 anthranilate synthase, component I [Archaeoglobus sulfaticallidus PM70-1]
MLFHKIEYVEPEKLYCVLRDDSYPFILESADKNELKARHTYISSNPEYIVQINKSGMKINRKRVSKVSNPFKALKNLINGCVGGERFVGGLVGYIPYQAVYNYIDGDLSEPAVFGFYPHVFVYDNFARTLYYNGDREYAEQVVSRAKSIEIETENGESNILSTDADRDDFVEMVYRAKDYILAGDAFQIVLSREYAVDTELTPFEFYRNLKRINPSPYMFLFEFEKAIAGASPETMASVIGNIVKINPIAGTIKRGKDGEEDEILIKKLMSDEKEIAEHIMLLDLARNDVRKVSRSGSVSVSRYMEVVKYSHVIHIESEVCGVLEDGKTAFDAMESAFPAGTLTGAPKIRAMEIIRELERSQRVVYGGCVGYFSSNGWADMAIAIRMAEFDGKCRVRAGAGIVSDSVPENEYYETERKMSAVLKALNLSCVEV